MEKTLTKGVCIIAAGNPIYGQMAMNLAMSIKYSQPDVHITLLWQGAGKNHVTQHIGGFFDEEIEIPEEYTKQNGMDSYLKAKMYLYDLSPYNKTIYLDADTIFFPKRNIGQLFDELNGTSFTIGNRGISDLSTDPRLIWSDLEEMRTVYGDVIIYNLSSEFMYFEKCEESRLFFDVAKAAFEDPGVSYVRFAGTVPDELAFQIAYIHTGEKPTKVPFLPFYWEPYEQKRLTLPQVQSTDFYGYSIGGAILSKEMKQNYDDLVRFYSNKFGIKYSFMCKSKKEWQFNRTNI